MDRPANAPSWDRWLQRFWYLFFALWALFVSLVITANFHTSPSLKRSTPPQHRSGRTMAPLSGPDRAASPRRAPAG
ncbi:MAG TPA: hypothetical protein VFE33_28135 [Thermoanaerobaculia bacterium]|nr:hypothetical protein [Thermoanaerobaculia bacterium]